MSLKGLKKEEKKQKTVNPELSIQQKYPLKNENEVDIFVEKISASAYQ